MMKGATEFVNAYTYAISQHKNFEREMKGILNDRGVLGDEVRVLTGTGHICSTFIMFLDSNR